MNEIHEGVKEALKKIPNFDFQLDKKRDSEAGMPMGPFKFTDGSTYLGEIFNGKRHGYGEVVFADGSCSDTREACSTGKSANC